MNWHLYYHLGIVALLALGLLGVAVRLLPTLCAPSKRRTRAEVALLCALVLLGLIAIYGNFYVERSYFAYGIGDIGSDTIEQYVPFYFNLIGNVRDGSLSLWNFEYELGVNVQAMQSWVFDPFNLIVVPLGLLLGDAHVSLALVISQSIKLALSALLFDHLLTRLCETPLARILGSALYAFSGFMIMYGQHYWFGGAFPLFTLVMLMFELHLERPRAATFLGVTVSCAIALAWSFYVAFMILLFAALYLLLRIPVYLKRTTPKTYALAVGRCALPVVCGTLLAGVTLLPYLAFLLGETARTSSDVSLAQRVVTKLVSFDNPDWVPAILSRTVGTGLLDTGAVLAPGLVSATPDIGFEGSFPYEFILLGYSAGVFVLLGQFLDWVGRECDRRDKTLVGVACALIVLYCFHQFLPTLFTAMVRLQFRSSFVIALPVCAAMAIGFEKRVLPGTVARGPLAISALLTLGVLAWSLLRTLNGRLVCLFYLLASCLIIAILALRSRPRPASSPAEFTTAGRIALVVLVGALVSTSVVDGFFDTNLRGTVPAEAFPLSGKTSHDADTRAALAYLREQGDGLYRIEKTYSDWSPLNDSLIQHFASASAYNSTPDADVDEFYEKLWKESVSTWAVYSQGFKNAPDVPEIANLLGIKYVLSQGPLNLPWLESMAQFGNVYVYKNAGADSLLTLRGRVTAESEANALDSAAARRQLIASSVIVPDDVASALTDTLGTSPANVAASASLAKSDDAHLTGTVTSSSDAVACLAIPHTGTWEIRVDGTPVSTFRADYGFVGFELSAGTHEIEATYRPTGLIAGMVMTSIGFILVALCIVLMRRQA